MTGSSAWATDQSDVRGARAVEPDADQSVVDGLDEPNPPDRNSRQARRRQRSRAQGPSDLVTLPVVFVVGGLITWARAPSVILHPRLWAEDGTQFFQSAYNLGWHAPLTLTYAGYLQTLSRLVADVGLAIPLSRVPLFFVVVALVFQVLPAVLMSSRRMARAVPDFRIRLLLAVVYLVVPNSAEVNVNLTDAEWHLAILAVLVVLAVPATGWWRPFDVAAIVLSGLSGPYVLSLMIVVVIVYVHRRQRWTLVLGALAAVTALIQLVELLTGTRNTGAPLGATVGRLVELLGGRLIGNTVLGGPISSSTAFTAHLLLYSTLLLVGATCIVLFAVWRGPFELKMFNLWAGLALAGALASPLITSSGSQWQGMITDVGARYWLFPSLAFLVDVIWLAGQFRSARRWAAVAAVVVLVALAAFGLRDDFRYPVVAAPNWNSQVQRFDRLPAGSSFVFRLRPAGWIMTLTKK